MSTSEKIFDLDAIHRELMQESFEALARLDGELIELERLTAVANAVGRMDIESSLKEATQANLARREVLSRFISETPTPVTVPKTIPRAERPKPEALLEPSPELIEVEVAPDPVVETKAPEQTQLAIEPLKIVSKPAPSLTRPAFEKRCKLFFAQERELWEGSGWSDSRECITKSLVCECRALIEAARELEQDPSHLWTSFNLLRELYNDHGAGDFYGFNTSRTQRVQTWSDLAQAFSLIPTADECLDWLASVDPGVESRDQLVVAAAAVESWLHRIGDEAGLGAVDFQQKRLHARIDRAKGETWIPWWKLGPDGQPTHAVATSAHSLSGLYRQTRERIERTSARNHALDALRELREALFAPGEIALTLYPAVLRALESGIPPSNKDLVAASFPYRQSLADMEDARLAKLLEYVDKHANKSLAKYKALPDLEMEADEPVEEGYGEILASVRAATGGKRVLFIGGKTQKQRVADLKKELAASEVVWPDSEPDTNAESFLGEAKKADVVCFVVKWSRHSYKRVIDFAKSEGKSVVTLKAGVGPRRIVHDLHEQLVKPRLELL